MLSTSLLCFWHPWYLRLSTCSSYRVIHHFVLGAGQLNCVTAGSGFSCAFISIALANATNIGGGYLNSSNTYVIQNSSRPELHIILQLARRQLQSRRPEYGVIPFQFLTKSALSASANARFMRT
ncbi:hypothetical protein C8J56DRAFT_1035985 [Mycena floridula]|nr:hypothetical protein C8J56DRAFT_1035985 [Mycena floridula]